MGEKTLELPEECWESIFKLIEKEDDRHDLSALSLVCKLFLSITNQVRKGLSIYDPTIQFIPQLLHRFKGLRDIDLSKFHGNINDVLYQISLSGLDLRSLNFSNQRDFRAEDLKVLSPKMKNLRCLKCSKVGSLHDNDLNLIADLFPLLEELDISYPEHRYSYSLNGLSNLSYFNISDSGIISLSVKLKGLRKLNLSGNHFITDKSLACLSVNCVLLNEIMIRYCDFVTQNGIALVICGCVNLNSLCANGIGFYSMDSRLKDSLVSNKALNSFDFSECIISDELLFSIAEACQPLNKLIVSKCRNFSFNSISFLLRKHQSLQYLDLEAASFLKDELMDNLSKLLPNITYINLSLCPKLSNSTFFILTKNCPLLSEIKMVGTKLGCGDFTMSPVTNPRVTSLNFAQNRCLDSNSIKCFASVCPNLRQVDLSNCEDLTEDGVEELLKRCSGIKNLGISGCIKVKTFLNDFEISYLEVLCARGLRINDDELALIGKRCPKLLQLDLTGCLSVTEKGVKEVVMDCKALREINLKWCNNVNVDIVSWMVVSRSSLWRIVPPCGFIPTDRHKKFFLRHGCLVCNG